jgi:hypothetical protein
MPTLSREPDHDWPERICETPYLTVLALPKILESNAFCATE